MTSLLWLQPVGTIRNVNDPQSEFVYQHRVQHGPSGEEIFIVQLFNPETWLILRGNSGNSGTWTGSYASPQDALSALQEEFERA